MYGSTPKNGPNEVLQAIITKLERNSLVELRLGFEEGEFRSKRDVQTLIKAVEEKFYHQLSIHKFSPLRSISIGWRLPNFALGPVLQTLIPLFLHDPVRITHLQLILNDNPPIPDGCLRRLLSWHTLECVDLRSVSVRVVATSSSRVQPSPPKQRYLGIASRSHNVKSKKVGFEESKNWKQENIVNMLPYASPSIKTLKLQCCGINEQHVVKLCEHIKRRMHGLKRLSLRQNFTLDRGYHHLFALRGIKCLDLSLCDLDEKDGYCIERAIEEYGNDDLKQLCLAGNYRLSKSMAGIVRAGAAKLTHVDCSFCGVGTKTQQEIFDILTEESTPSNCKKCTLQSFRMQGIILADVEGLVKCIRHNISIRSLMVDHPRETFYTSTEDRQKIIEALKLNYSLEVLKFDYVSSQCPGSVESFDFWLKLNRCGRRALLQTNEGFNSWTKILTQAAESNDHNILFWVLQHGSVMLK